MRGAHTAWLRVRIAAAVMIVAAPLFATEGPAPGDTIVLYTDGVTEAMNGDGDQFGVERIQEVFEANPPTDSEQATHALFDAVREFVGDTPQSDDITCLVLRRAQDSA